MTHAIGDAANRQVLDVYEELLASMGRGKANAGAAADLRWRVEHVQILAREDMSRFAHLGVIPSMQPSHCAADLSYAEERLGPERVRTSYAWQTLLNTGVEHLPFGSDFPTAGRVPPMLALHAAVTRETPEGAPPGGWFPSQRVTREQAIKGYTVDAAFASFREAELGRLLPGYLADMVVLDQDVLTVEAMLILNTTVLGTVVGGRVVYPLPQKDAHSRQQGCPADCASASSESSGPTTACRPMARVSRDLARLACAGVDRGALGIAGAAASAAGAEGQQEVAFWEREYAEGVREERHERTRGVTLIVI